ncbi:hypothetical protein [Dyella acidisoli]|uniref:hypothetical protein n=1 Tax=Dyella acidisoli TaxID=1867834 RepID=UPI0024E05AC1|nr:hypothetical protein [Dyella acidisoli]
MGRPRTLGSEQFNQFSGRQRLPAQIARQTRGTKTITRSRFQHEQIATNQTRLVDQQVLTLFTMGEVNGFLTAFLGTSIVSFMGSLL